MAQPLPFRHGFQKQGGQGVSDLKGKVAFVTGGTGGIGRGIALRLAGRGADIAVNGRDPAKGAAVVAGIEALGRRACFVAGDVRSRADMDAAMAETVRRLGGVDIVVANAGGSDDEARSPKVRGPFPDIDLELAAAFIAKSVLGKLLVVQAAIPHLRQRGGGSVVFITTEGGRAPTPGQTAVATFSAGIIQASKLLSKELARDRIRVNCVCVTLVRDTPSWDAAFNTEGGVSGHHRGQYEKIIARAPFGVASAEEIGDVVGFFASGDSRYLTGTVVSPTGGLTLH